MLSWYDGGEGSMPSNGSDEGAGSGSGCAGRGDGSDSDDRLVMAREAAALVAGVVRGSKAAMLVGVSVACEEDEEV